MERERSENAGYTKSRRVIGMRWANPRWVANERRRTAGAAAGIGGRVIFAACWAGMPIKTFAKIAIPRLLQPRCTTPFRYAVHHLACANDLTTCRDALPAELTDFNYARGIIFRRLKA